MCMLHTRKAIPHSIAIENPYGGRSASNFSAERHHARSQKFFYGMLGAQLGVIVSTFAMA